MLRKMWSRMPEPKGLTQDWLCCLLLLGYCRYSLLEIMYFTCMHKKPFLQGKRSLSPRRRWRGRDWSKVSLHLESRNLRCAFSCSSQCWTLVMRNFPTSGVERESVILSLISLGTGSKFNFIIRSLLYVWVDQELRMLYFGFQMEFAMLFVHVIYLSFLFYYRGVERLWHHICLAIL